MANSQSNDGSLMACGLIAEPSPPVQLPPRLVEEFLTATEGVATPGLIFGSREQGGQLRYLAHQVTIPVDPRYESLRWQPETQEYHFVGMKAAPTFTSAISSSTAITGPPCSAPQSATFSGRHSSIGPTSSPWCAVLLPTTTCAP
jgi:hypothetical protein